MPILLSIITHQEYVFKKKRDLQECCHLAVLTLEEWAKDASVKRTLIRANIIRVGTGAYSTLALWAVVLTFP